MIRSLGLVAILALTALVPVSIITENYWRALGYALLLAFIVYVWEAD